MYSAYNQAQIGLFEVRFLDWAIAREGITLMTGRDLTEEELESMIEQLVMEAEVTHQAFGQRGEFIDEEYADQIVRGQIQEMRELLDSIKRVIGEGEAVSVTNMEFIDGDE